MQLKVGSMFAGIGGIEKAFQINGSKIIWANEIDKSASKTYEANFKHALFLEDVKNIDVLNLKKIDVLTAGFPCQSFSVAGHRKGLTDERGQLFYETIRFARELKPKYILLENVKNLYSHNNGKTFKIILKELKNLNYYTKYEILNTATHANIPQNRERLYIVAFQNYEEYKNFEFPKKIKLTKNIHNILEDTVEEKYFYEKYKNIYNNLVECMDDKMTFYQWRRQYVRKNKNGLCPTLTANMGTGGHNVPLVIDKNNNRIRKLTPRECARLQGYSDNYILPKELSDNALYKQLGNSVTIPLVNRVVKNLKKAIKKDGN